jgi:hypothetical protein
MGVREGTSELRVLGIDGTRKDGEDATVAAVYILGVYVGSPFDGRPYRLRDGWYIYLKQVDCTLSKRLLSSRRCQQKSTVSGHCTTYSNCHRWVAVL